MAVYKPQIKTNNGVVDLDIQAERALKDGNGDPISSTYVKSVNNTTPANGNIDIKGKYTLKQIWSGNQAVIPFSNMSENVSNTWLLVTLSENISEFNYTPTLKIPIYVIDGISESSNGGVWLYSTGQNKWLHLFVFTNSNELSARIVVCNGGTFGAIRNYNIIKVEKMEISG